MRNLLLLLLITSLFQLNAQENTFELSSSKKSLINQFIVLNMDNLSQSDGYIM